MDDEREYHDLVIYVRKLNLAWRSRKAVFLAICRKIREEIRSEEVRVYEIIGRQGAGLGREVTGNSLYWLQLGREVPRFGRGGTPESAAAK